MTNQEVYPKTERGAIPLRVGVGGSPESVIRAARLDANLALAIIGGDPARFAPYAKLYYDALDKMHKPHRPISIHSPGHIADTDEQAIEEMWPAYEAAFGRIGVERGWPPVTFSRFEAQRGPRGAYLVGNPEEVAEKILRHSESLGGIDRLTFQMDNAGLSHQQLSESIALIGEEVIPKVNY